ncbi:MAG: hypothetical protein L7V86_20480, partial [Verrucomicrobiales bacterium]|nr:hypothetical protein [Verrucomicrobiales bacterium]
TYLPEFRCAFLYDPMSTETPRWLYADDEFLTARDFETEISFPEIKAASTTVIVRRSLGMSFRSHGASG